jgi:LuxR family maltose regulon positive regulatory protein
LPETDPSSSNPPRPGSPRCGASRPISPDASEIGATLYISLNTVKTHTRELYRKLGASSRTDAVAQAEAFGLLELTESPG